MEPLQRPPDASLTTRLVERIADYKGVSPDDPEFCLYESTDPEALEILLGSTDGPFTTQFRVDDASVTVSKTVEGEVTIEVDAAEPRLHAVD